VALQLQIQFRTLGATASNGIPIILNREFSGGILVKEGEPAVVAGMVNDSEEKSLTGLPLVSRVPGLGVLTSQNTKQDEEDELLMLITPYVVRSPERSDAPDIWLTR
jgi:general secretion pathway protein D